jgi:hypothetical protein
VWPLHAVHAVSHTFAPFTPVHASYQVVAFTLSRCGWARAYHNLKWDGVLRHVRGEPSAAAPGTGGKGGKRPGGGSGGSGGSGGGGGGGAGGGAGSALLLPAPATSGESTGAGSGGGGPRGGGASGGSGGGDDDDAVMLRVDVLKSAPPPSALDFEAAGSQCPLLATM